MTRRVLILAGVLAWAGARAAGGTVLYSPLDDLKGWSVRSAGAGGAKVVDLTETARCVEVQSRRGTVFLSRELPLADVAGARVTVSCLVKTEQIVRGPQISSTGKIHLAVRTAKGLTHHAARFTGSSEWHSEGLSADIPKGATRVVLNLGLEASFGRAWFDRLVVRNDRRGVYPLDLSAAANAGREQLKLPAAPKGELTWEGVRFRLLDAARNDKRDCIRLRSTRHPDWPPAIGEPIPVGKVAPVIYILHAALDGQAKNSSPCTMWTARFAGGDETGFSTFEGNSIGAIGAGEDSANWKVAWRGKDAAGKPITYGVTKWETHSDELLESITCKAYTGGAPVVLAVTVVEEPPRKAQPEEDPGESGDSGGSS